MNAPVPASPSPLRHVALVTEQVEPGGKRSHVETLIAGLEAIGWRASLLDRRGLAAVERAWIAGPTRLLNAIRPAAGWRWLIPAMDRAVERQVAAFDRRSSPGFFHVQEALTFAGVRRAAGGRPVALTVHGPMHREVASAYGIGLGHPVIRRLAALESEAYRDADLVISVDRAHAEYVRSFGRGGPIEVIANFVDTRRFHPGVPATATDPALEAWIAGRPVVLCPRRLVPKNGVGFAIRALRALADRGAACVLVITGGGPQRVALETLAAELGVAERVRFLGDTPYGRMPAWSRRAAVVVVPSVPSQGVEEATSISVLEAQACGRPVVASALGGILEIVTDGVTGLLVPPGDADALAGAVARILADPALSTALGAAAAAHVLAEHSHLRAARRYADAYLSIGAPTAA